MADPNAKHAVRCPNDTCGYKAILKNKAKADAAAYTHKYRYGNDHVCEIVEFKRKPPKSQSRATRLTMELDKIEVVKERVRAICGNLESMELDAYIKYDPTLEMYQIDIDSSGIEELRDEMQSWADNLSGANMEHLPKFEEVEATRDALDEIIGMFDLEIPDLPDGVNYSDRDDLLDSLNDYIDQIDQIIQMDGTVEFPRAF